MPPDARRAPDRPPLIGLTGSIAAGKSEALAALDRLGAATLSSDDVVHELLSSPEVAARLAERWGEDVAPGGTVDRARVGERVFSSPEELGWLEAVLHPLVGQRVADWVVGLPAHTSVAVVEVPLLYETDMESLFDATIAVVADDGIRAERAAARGTELFEGRAGRQLPQAEKEARARFVVRNDGDLSELEAQLAELWPQLAAAGSAVT